MPTSSIRSQSGGPPQALGRLREIAAIRPELAGISSLEGIALRGAEIAQQRVKSQLASIFLLNQTGLLERIALVGFDSKGLPVKDKSIPEEKHSPGLSFTGKAVPSDRSSLPSFGQAQWTNRLADYRDISAETRLSYEKIVGKLKAGVAVPLNGSNRTFGVLEVINKHPSAESAIFSVDDSHWLALIAIEIAKAISDQRRASQLKILSNLAQDVLTSFERPVEDEIYQSVARSLVASPLPYRVVIIRLLKEEDLVTAATAANEVSLDGRIDNPLEKNESIAARVLSSGKAEYIEDITTMGPALQIKRNREWAFANKLRSHYCMPLATRTGKSLGTLSIYFGMVYRLDSDEIEFLSTLARSLAAFCNLKRLARELQEFTREDASDTAAAEHESLGLAIGHDIAHTLTLVSGIVAGLEGKNLRTAQGKADFDQADRSIGELVKQAREDLLSVKPEVIDINELLRQVVNQRRRIPFNIRIEYRLTLARQIPPVLARTSALRFVIKDLLSNAAKSIRRTGDTYGVITIATARKVEKAGIDQIEITVADTGEGIERSRWEQIFEPGISSDSGTGRGLSLAKAVLETLGGSVSVIESTVGDGAAFRVLIPAHHAA